MSRRSSVTKVLTSEKNGDLNDLFNQMVGSDRSANFTIIYGKYKQLEECVDKLLKLLDIIGNSPILELEVLSAARNDVLDYRTKQRSLWNNTKMTYFDSIMDPSRADEAHKAELLVVWPKMKGSALVASMVATFDTLAPYRADIERSEKSVAFIIDMPGPVWAPIAALPTLNLKYICSVTEDAAVKRLIMSFLNKMLGIGQDIYKIKMNPDFDITECSEVIVKSIMKLRGIPELSRCGKAFAKIEKSLNLLEGNFDKYHRDYLSTGNPHIILENFCQDTSKKTDIDPETAMQFKAIINFYRKQSTISTTQPKLAKILDTALAPFDTLEEHFAKPMSPIQP